MIMLLCILVMMFLMVMMMFLVMYILNQQELQPLLLPIYLFEYVYFTYFSHLVQLTQLFMKKIYLFGLLVVALEVSPFVQLAARLTDELPNQLYLKSLVWILLMRLGLQQLLFRSGRGL